MILTKRIYETPEKTDGYRILVDRIWPRGVSKEKAHLDEWFKEIAPSSELRKVFHGGEIDFSTFKTHYLAEIKENLEASAFVKLIQAHNDETITLLFAAKDEQKNQAVVLQEWLQTQ